MSELVIKKGWLFKWTNYLKGYQKRWFVLQNGVLSYYRAEQQLLQQQCIMNNNNDDDNGTTTTTTMMTSMKTSSLLITKRRNKNKMSKKKKKRNQAEMSHTCRGSISLHGALIHTVDACTFVISNGGTQTFHIKAANEKERQEWVTALELQKAKAIRNMESEEEEEQESQLISTSGSPSEWSSVVRDLQSKLSELRNFDELIVKHAQAVQNALGELEKHSANVMANAAKNRANMLAEVEKAAKNATNKTTNTSKNTTNMVIDAEKAASNTTNMSTSNTSNIGKNTSNIGKNIAKNTANEEEQRTRTEDVMMLAATAKVMNERCNLFKIISVAMTKSCSEYLQLASSQGHKWTRLLQHEREQRQRLQEMVETLAQQHSRLEEKAAKNANSNLATLSSEDEEDEEEENEFYDAIADSSSDSSRGSNKSKGKSKSSSNVVQQVGVGGNFCSIKGKGNSNTISCSNNSGVSSPSEGTQQQIVAVTSSPAAAAAEDTTTISNYENPTNFTTSSSNSTTSTSNDSTNMPKNSKPRRTRVPDKPNYPLNLWSIMKNCIGKDLSKIPMPVNFSEPLSMLQRLTEDYEYAEILDEAAKCNDVYEQLALVAAFTISSYSTTTNRTAKPFNPLLGETFECDRTVDLGWRSFSEQVSHHPPMVAQFCEGRGWRCWQEFTMTSKFRGKYLQVVPLGTAHVEFLTTNTRYSWRKVTTTVHNIIVGRLWVDHHGEMDIRGGKIFGKSFASRGKSMQNYGKIGEEETKFDGRMPEEEVKSRGKPLEDDASDKTYVNTLKSAVKESKNFGKARSENLLGKTLNLNCHLKYVPYSYFSKESQRRVKGSVTDEKGEVRYVINGTWDDKVEIAKVLPGGMGGREGMSSDGGSSREAFFRTEKPRIAWKRRMPPKESENYYNFTVLAAQLNEPEDGVAPTDSRLRPDQRLMEEGNWDEANKEKVRIEEKQRAARRRREAEAEESAAQGRPFTPYVPLWFDQRQTEDSNQIVHEFNGKYWECKEKGDWTMCPDIF